MIVLIDNGHGCDTPGKCSPDGRHREWLWTRRCAVILAERLRDAGIDARLLVTEDTDIPLRERCRRANAIHSPATPTILVSIHNNAAGADGCWHDASGFSAFVAPSASDASRRLASIFTAEAAARGLLGNRCTPSEGYWTASLAICRNTRCPAVLTENLFQDNRRDVDFLSSPEGLTTIVELHSAALLTFCKSRP